MKIDDIMSFSEREDMITSLVNLGMSDLSAAAWVRTHVEERILKAQELFAEAHEAELESAWQEGWQEGFETGQIEQNADSYNEGYDEGYSDGLTEGRAQSEDN